MPTAPMTEVDVLVIGGGIAGASIAWALAADHRVALLETEPTLGLHATGRSAATFVESLGRKEIRALTTSSRAFLESPPEGFGVSPLRPMSFLYAARSDELDELDELYEEVRDQIPSIERLTASQSEQVCPWLRPGVIAGGLREPGAMEIDVAGLHADFVRALRGRAGEIVRSAELVEADHDGTAWSVTDSAGARHRATILVDAAGAWADVVAQRCGVAPVGMTPYRRTIFTIPAGLTNPAGSPMVVDLKETCYIKPESGQFLCSPVDETPSDPGDPRVDELDVAQALEAIDELTLLAPRRVTTTWAGLRTFADDRLPVVGADPSQPAFFWYAGQGGFGVQASPALARLGAAVLAGRALPEDLAAAGLGRETFRPDRPGLRRNLPPETQP